MCSCVNLSNQSEYGHPIQKLIFEKWAQRVKKQIAYYILHWIQSLHIFSKTSKLPITEVHIGLLFHHLFSFSLLFGMHQNSPSTNCLWMSVKYYANTLSCSALSGTYSAAHILCIIKCDHLKRIVALWNEHFRILQGAADHHTQRVYLDRQKGCVFQLS